MTDHSPVQQIERVRNSLAALLVMAFISTIPLFVFKTIPGDNKEIIVYMVGQLSGMALMALGFYFTNKVGQDALDAKRTDNTNKALEAITTVATATGGTDAAAQAAEETADAAVEKADEIAGKIPKADDGPM